MHPHLRQLRDALAAEDAWQRDDLERARAASLEDQVALGVAWPRCTVASDEPAGRGRSEWVVRAPRGVALHDGIDVGAPVDVEADGHVWVGRVVGRDERTASIRVDSDDEAPTEVLVAKRHDASAMRLLRDVLAGVPEEVGGVAAVLLGAEPTHEEDAGRAGGLALDPSQEAAVTHALGAQDVALIHGPPGTGKTRTLAALLAELVARGERPWALADSNAAADNLALRAASNGLRVVRVGLTARMRGGAADLSLDAAIRRHPLWPAVARIDRELSRLRSYRSPGGRQQIRELYRERRDLVDQARASVLEGAQVLAMTLGTLLRRAERLPPARTAVVDEATQAIEPSVWAVVPWVERLVLVGDPHQLGPVVFQPGNPLARGLLQRLVEEGMPAPMLQTQYRMHADIAEMVGEVYGPAYVPDASVAGHRLVDLPGVAEGPWTTAPLTFVDTAGAGLDEALDARSGSRFNAGEAEVVRQVVAAWRQAGVAPEQIGVVTPYRAQVARLAALPELAGVEVDTVNAFQGREKEALIVSFVRSNPDGEVGFVSDRRRLTVALTRGRRAWVGVGDSATLASAPGVDDMVTMVEAAGGLQSVWEWDLDR